MVDAGRFDVGAVEVFRIQGWGLLGADATPASP